MKRIRLTQSKVDVLVNKCDGLFTSIGNFSFNEKVETVNKLKMLLHKFGSSQPVDCVKRVSFKQVKANDYNPNVVAPPEMALLETSIWEDGYTQPIVTYYDKSVDTYIVIDGFHRYLTLKNSKRIYDREKGLLPIVVIDKHIGDRMASTIRHNRARGTHNVELMSTIVAELVEMGKGDHWICKHIGMSVDELLRLKQITGVAALFSNRDFSDSWEADVDNNYTEDVNDFEDQKE